jgi:hypothetical protein
MLCRTVLGKVPLVLKPFTNCTIDERPEPVAELIPIAENKLSPIHYFTSDLPGRYYYEKPSTCDSRIPVPNLQRIYRIYPNVWMPVTTRAGELRQLKKISSDGRRFIVRAVT